MNSMRTLPGTDTFFFQFHHKFISFLIQHLNFFHTKIISAVLACKETNIRLVSVLIIGRDMRNSQLIYIA